MQDKYKNYRYFIYARKSTESDDRQIQSIDDQIHRLKMLAIELDLTVAGIFTESKSAKRPNNRPEFEKMMEQIANGEADGILCWKLDRLSRNPIDSGQLQWLLQQGELKAIRTIERFYLPEDNVLVFNVETGMANQYILDLSKNVKRGLESKLRKGIFPNRPPLGYLNAHDPNTGENIIVNDLERYELVKDMWNYMLSGNYTPPQLIKIMNDKWKIRTRESRKRKSKKLSRSGIYRMLTNIFYAGIIESKGIQYIGNHEPMVTLDEFNRVQYLLGKSGKSKAKIRQFPFTGLIFCASCGGTITAETKTKLIKSTGKIKQFSYYHCTKRKTDRECSEKHFLRANELEQQFGETLKNITIVSNFREKALKQVQEMSSRDTSRSSGMYDIQLDSLKEYNKQLDTLLELRLREQIGNKEYEAKRKELVQKIVSLKSKIQETEERAKRWREIAIKIFNYTTFAMENFDYGDIQIKKEIVRSLGSNYTLHDGKLMLKLSSWFTEIKNCYPHLEQLHKSLELGESPAKYGFNSKESALAFIDSEWRGRRDSNSRPHA